MKVGQHLLSFMLSSKDSTICIKAGNCMLPARVIETKRGYELHVDSNKHHHFVEIIDYNDLNYNEIVDGEIGMLKIRTRVKDHYAIIQICRPVDLNKKAIKYAH